MSHAAKIQNLLGAAICVNMSVSCHAILRLTNRVKLINNLKLNKLIYNLVVFGLTYRYCELKILN